MSPSQRTLQWVEDFVIKLQLCPFAARPHREQRVVCIACTLPDVPSAFYWAGAQVQQFVQQDAVDVETTLLVFTEVLSEFEAFLDFIEEIQLLLDESGGSELVQLAHFHPHYVFAEQPADDPANATNRSPYPTLQLLRVAQVAKAVAAYPDPEKIPERNATLLRQRKV
ncbi:hypothetical protein LEM8419_02902 [Neolewinella maritima]|uniref:DUF1415 domain-containing protein n=1 Tax=Neolewinella maritima TaxID=1383882 RepID=A0ABM9B407_9BACT|nr:DUF1415 domain-containing protein [Neolewinella maritima]CAH1001987.1 hypothetical protein LEM8419_02902 [Neolewinella maritima]